MRLPSDRIRLVYNFATVVLLLLLALWARHDRSALWMSVCLLLAAAQALSMVWQRWGTRVR